MEWLPQEILPGLEVDEALFACIYGCLYLCLGLDLGLSTTVLVQGWLHPENLGRQPMALNKLLPTKWMTRKVRPSILRPGRDRKRTGFRSFCETFSGGFQPNIPEKKDEKPHINGCREGAPLLAKVAGWRAGG